MRLKIAVDIDTTSDREGETPDDEQRIADMAHEDIARALTGLVDRAREQGMHVTVTSD